MSSMSWDSNYSSSSSSDDELSFTTNILQDDTEEDTNSHAIGKKLFHACIAAYVPQIISSTSTFKKNAHGGSTIGRRYIRRERKERHELIMNDYFRGETSKYTPEHFRRRFRMDIELFMRVLHAIENYDDYFTQKFDAVGNIGLSPLQKMIAAVRMLAYGCAADQLDEYVQIGESTTIESLQHFCDAVIGVFEKQYLRKPNHEDIKVLLKEGEARGFPGMLGSLDCMHWHWKNCPTAWHGTHTNGFKRVPTLILEIVASKSLWIWHAFFGMAGTNNDITVLDRSPLFDDIINGVAPPCSFMVHGHRYNMGYYLSDGIYSQYATLIQSISQPSSVKEKLFAKQQEAIRKDVERAFGVLQSRWHIVRGPARMWNAKLLGKIMKTCIILHNMIIEREFLQGINPENWQQPTEETANPINVEHDFSFLVTRMIDRTARVHDKGVHKELKSDLINHFWDMFGDS